MPTVIAPERIIIQYVVLTVYSTSHLAMLAVKAKDCPNLVRERYDLKVIVLCVKNVVNSFIRIKWV